MEPATRNFTIVEGDTFVASLTLTDKATGLAIDLTGATPKMQVRTTYNAAASSLDFTVGSGITVPTPVNGVILISKTMPLSAGDYVYDFQTTVGSVITTYMRGRFKVLEGVTV